MISFSIYSALIGCTNNAFGLTLTSVSPKEDWLRFRRGRKVPTWVTRASAYITPWTA